MHRSTRQIWSSSSSSCCFCDLQLLGQAMVRTSPFGPQARLQTQAQTGHGQSRGKRTLHKSLARRQKSVSNIGTLSGQIGRPPRFIPALTSLSQLERGACTFLKGITPRVQSLPLAGPHPTGSIALSPSIPTQPPPPRISVRSPRFISTSTTSSIASDLEAEITSMSLSGSIPSSTPPILDLSTAVKETASEFHRLFPAQPRKTLVHLTHERSRDHAPWRNQTMQPGSALEEALRKAVYQRDPISAWWPMYDELSKLWANQHSGESTLTRTDFVRIITAVKVSQHPARVQRLERLFEDFHLAIDTQKSNVRVYTTFLETIQFWKMKELIPLWIQRIRSKIVLPVLDSSTNIPSVLPPNSVVRESPQEQYHDLMRVLANVDLMEPMLDCLQELKAIKSDLLMPSTKAYDTILEVYMRRKDTTRAMQLVQDMKDHGLPPQLTTFNILLNAHLENKDARAAQRVLESLLLTDIKPDIYTFNVLMAGYLNMGEFELVNGFYKGLGEYGLVPNSKTYRILLKSHLKQGHVKQVVDLFCQLKESPRPELHPGSEDYRILIQALASNNKMPEALKVLQEMIDGKKVPVTTWIYNVFLTQYARQGQVDKARRILDRIIVEKLPLVDGSINPLIRAYLARKDLDQVAEMTDLLTQYGIQPSSTTFNIMINSTKASGNLEGAMKLYERMAAEGVAPDVWTYNTLLDILVGKLMPRKGGVARKGSPNTVQDSQVAEYIPKIETLLQDMKAKGIKPNATTYGKLIHQYVLLQNMEQAEMLFHEMVKSGISPNSYVFNTLMNGFTAMEEMDKAVELFRRMPKYGVEPDAASFTTLVKGYANLQELKLAQNFANTLQLRSSKIKLDQFCFHTLMQLAQKSNQPGMALDFFEMMRGRGIEADHYTFTILLNALSRDLAGANSSSRPKRRGNRKIESGLAPESTVEAVESILSMIQQDSQSLNHSQITTILSAYFRLGRPQAAIEFFKTRYWKGEPKLNTTNCGALFHGLLAPEHNRRYDGIVLNLYSKMLSGTRDLIRAEEEYKRRLEELKVSDDDSTTATSAPGVSANKLKQMGDWSGPRGPWADSSTSSSSSSRSLSRPSSPSTPSSFSSSRPPSFAPRYDLPPVDLILVSIMFQSFSQRQNWGIVLQLWQDVESIGVDKLYPFRMPLEFLGWAAEAFHRTSDLSNNTTRRCISTTGDQEQRHHQPAQDSETQGEEKAEELLRRLWNAHDRMGVQWSYRIYGFNMFESLTSSSSSSSSALSSGSGWDSQPSPSAPSSVLSHFLSGENGQSYGRPSSDIKPSSSSTSENASEDKDEEEEPKSQGWHRL